ncbi:hypothetical protein [Micromonospora sp. DT68]|uniref:hypothetical protein n=1 Tax=unclassified Micromonospora TaxID=2617518 RepID=UPI003CF05378
MNGHLPVTPNWGCADCEQEWPCPDGRRRLLAEHHRTPVLLFHCLSSCYASAVADLPGTVAIHLHARFLGWLPRTPPPNAAPTTRYLQRTTRD